MVWLKIADLFQCHQVSFKKDLILSPQERMEMVHIKSGLESPQKRLEMSSGLLRINRHFHSKTAGDGLTVLFAKRTAGNVTRSPEKKKKKKKKRLVRVGLTSPET